jgi:hypothetical protein
MVAGSEGQDKYLPSHGIVGKKSKLRKEGNTSDIKSIFLVILL